MAKSGISIGEVYTQLQGNFSQWKTKAQAAQAQLNAGSSVSADILAFGIYHDARRTLEVLDQIQAKVVSKGWAQNLRDYGASQQGEVYDVVAEALSLRALLIDLQSLSITALGGVDVNGFLTQPYVKLTDTGPFFRQIPAVDYAAVVTKLQEIDSSITED